MELAELSDRTEINEALNRYTIAVDTGEWDRLDTVFTPDARIDYTESGGIAASFAEVKPWLAENLPAFSRSGCTPWDRCRSPSRTRRTRRG